MSTVAVEASWTDAFRDAPGRRGVHSGDARAVRPTARPLARHGLPAAFNRAPASFLARHFGG